MPARPIFNNLRAVAEKLDEDYIACLVGEARLPQTRLQFSREVAVFSAGGSDFTAG
jgi:hypothetical protein